MKSLTKPERETVINWSDDDRTAYVWTAQRPVITKLKANESAELVAEGFVGSTAWAEFRLPARLVSFRNRPNRVSADVAAKRTERLLRARAAQKPRKKPTKRAG
jgi:hypothetical protein